MKIAEQLLGSLEVFILPGEVPDLITRLRILWISLRDDIQLLPGPVLIVEVHQGVRPDQPRLQVTRVEREDLAGFLQRIRRVSLGQVETSQHLARHDEIGPDLDGALEFEPGLIHLPFGDQGPGQIKPQQVVVG